MSSKIIWTLFKKEIKDIFRDTKTIVITLMVPLVLYPLVFLGSMLLMSSMMKESTVKTYKVAIISDNQETVNILRTELKDSLESRKYHFEISNIEDTEDKEKLIRDEKYDVILKPESEADGTIKDITVYGLTSINRSSTAISMIDNVLDDYKRDLIDNNLRAIIPDYDKLKKDPFKTNKVNFSTKEETTGMLIGYIMPFMMTVSVITGAFAVSIDLSVGEKERGTLETLITLPIKNIEFMLAKFFAITAFSLFSVALNIFSYALMGIYIYNSMKLSNMLMGGLKFVEFIPSFLIMFIVIPLFACLVSAISLCVDFTAKSVKEANNLSTVMMLVFMMGGVVADIPNVKLNHWLALVPVANVTLLIKELFMLNIDASLIMTVVLSTLIYTLVVVIIMTKVFSSEDVLFSDGLRSIKIFERRANMKENQIPGVGDIVFMFAIMFLISNFAGSYFILKSGVLGLAITQGSILLVPILYSWYMKVDFKNVYSIKMPRINEVIGALVLMIGSYIFNTVLVTWLMDLLPSLAANNDSIEELIGTGGFIPSLFIIGIMPAFAEEAAFRGFLYGTLKNKKIPIAATMVITAVVFAAYHMNLLQFIYVTIMGLIMSYMIFNSKSIFVTCIFHAVNNSMSVVFSYYPKVAEKIPFITDDGSDPKRELIALFVAIGILALGFFISDNKIGIFRVRNKEKKENT
ncbi:MAG: CPBP family intramembrane metalloprotease [Lachnospiraceae bacterium]|nr:CPBP family intramembrane metalloprotease [Lachnospiraceae bacterium]